MTRSLNFLLPAFVVVAIAVGIAPYDRATWLLENMMTVLFGGFLFFQQRRQPLSATSWCLIFAFGLLHTIGAHYTYSLVPYNEWTRTVFGTSLNEAFGWERNHFDRLIHLLYGLCFTPAVQHSLRQRWPGMGMAAADQQQGLLARIRSGQGHAPPHAASRAVQLPARLNRYRRTQAKMLRNSFL